MTTPSTAVEKILGEKIKEGRIKKAVTGEQPFMTGETVMKYDKKTAEKLSSKCKPC